MHATFQSAFATYDDKALTVSTGAFTRTWRLTDAGLLTTSLVDEATRFAWPTGATPLACDWDLPGVDAAGQTGCVLVAIRMARGDDEGFTSPHLAVTVDLHYPGPAMRVRFVVWAYPKLPGLRTQLWLRPGVARRIRHLESTGRAEHLPIAVADADWHAAGYHNHTQARNAPGLDLLQRLDLPGPHAEPHTVDWASLAWASGDRHALALVKESYKCVNQSGCDTGSFTFDPQAGLASSGWGLAGATPDPHIYHPAWAHWSLLAPAKEPDLRAALQRFDRTRFGFDPARDVYLIANTWGSRANDDAPGRGSRDAATEPNILAELDVAADLGIDVVQIDDGWQLPADLTKTWRPPDAHGWRPHPTMFPHGWAAVRRRAADLGVRLGLWSAAQWISLEELLENDHAGGFTQWKLDFAYLPRHEDIRELIDKMRRFVQATGHRVRLNLDVTEHAPRFGYYFGREFGCCYLENRKPRQPEPVVYVPHLVLRDFWQLAHFTNPFRFQGSVQNVRTVNPDASDAPLHPQAYALAIALATTPVFFMELQTLSAEDRDAIRPLLRVYRAHRQRMYRSVVHPIGDPPSNAGWSGFQCCADDQPATGYLLLFRERLNEQPTRTIPLHQLSGQDITLTNLLTGEAATQPLDPAGVRFELPDAPGFAFCQYQVT